MKVFLFFLTYFWSLQAIPLNFMNMKTIQKNGMTVHWKYTNDRVYFEMKAPTKGWVAIGFNETEHITGNYLLMGNVINNRANVVEHITLGPGSYQSFATLKKETSVKDIKGIEDREGTTLQFSVPITSNNPYTKDLSERKRYVLLLAYSQEDDFQHHSMMRTLISIQL